MNIRRQMALVLFRIGAMLIRFILKKIRAVPSSRYRQSLGLLAVVFMIVAVSGCRMRTPFGGPPGNKDYQRSGAVVYDPFPDANAGPNIEGGRPLGYQRPINDTARSQMNSRPSRPAGY